MQIKVEGKGLLWSRWYEKYFRWSFHILFCLWIKRIHLVTCSKIEFREPYYCSRCAPDKICEIFTFDPCPHGWSSQKSFLACVDAKKKKTIGEQLHYFWNVYPKPFSWAKNKRKLFSDGKSRGPLLARAALKVFLLRCISKANELLKG